MKEFRRIEMQGADFADTIKKDLFDLRANYESEIEERDSKIEELEAEVKSLEAKVEELEGEIWERDAKGFNG